MRPAQERRPRGAGFLPFAAAALLSAVATPFFVAYGIAYRRFDLFDSGNPRWRSRAIVDLLLIDAPLVPYLAIAAAGVWGLHRGRRFGRAIAIARAVVSLAAVAVSVVVVPVGMVIVFTGLTAVLREEPKHLLIVGFMLPGLLAECSYVAAGFRAVTSSLGKPS